MPESGAPLLNEREEFLRRLEQQGTSHAALRNLSGELIHVARLLRLRELRDVSPEKIHRAAKRFARQQLSGRCESSASQDTSPRT